jgi:O-succinylbenzoic acid--CoA ligase
LNEHQCLEIECDHLPSIVETTDVVNLLSEDTFEWLGRSDNIINTGGIKVSSESLESVFTKLIDANLIIFGVPNDILGQQIAIAIESDSEDYFLEKVRSINSSLLSTLKPRTLYILDHFSYTKTDKINRNKTISRINIESGIQL